MDPTIKCMYQQLLTGSLVTRSYTDHHELSFELREIRDHIETITNVKWRDGQWISCTMFSVYVMY